MRSEFEGRLAVLVEPLERAVLDGVREFEDEPDRIRVGLGIVPVFLDERPLVGLGGLIDWRSSGRLSGVLRSGFFKGAVGEQLLMPGDRRWPIDRLVLLGLGPRAEFDERRARDLGSRGVEIAAGLSASHVLIALPAQSIARSLVEAAFDALLEAIERAAIEQAHELAQGETKQARVNAQPGPAASPAAGPDAAAEQDGEAPVEDGAAILEEPSIEPLDEAEGPRDAAVLSVAGSESGAHPEPEAPAEALDEGQPALESQAQDADPEPNGRVAPRWWVVVDEAVVARLRRVRSGPPRAARGGPRLHT